jgi:hypothetical protein
MVCQSGIKRNPGQPRRSTRPEPDEQIGCAQSYGIGWFQGKIMRRDGRRDQRLGGLQISRHGGHDCPDRLDIGHDDKGAGAQRTGCQDQQQQGYRIKAHGRDQLATEKEAL